MFCLKNINKSLKYILDGSCSVNAVDNGYFNSSCSNEEEIQKYYNSIESLAWKGDLKFVERLLGILSKLPGDCSCS